MLFDKGERPAAFIDNQPILRLTVAQHDVVRALLKAGQKGLSKKLLAKNSDRGGAVRVLKRLAKSHDLWARVI